MARPATRARTRPRTSSGSSTTGPTCTARPRTFLEPKDYLNLRLTGRAVASVDSIAGHFVTDNRDLDHVVYDDQLIEFSRARPGDAAGAGARGRRGRAAARRTRRPSSACPPGIDVVAGTPDVQSATLGSGALADFQAHLYLGTSSWITCHVPFKKTDLFANMASLPAAVPNRYFVGNDQETAGACLGWLRDNVLWPDDALGTGPPPADAFARIDALAATAPVGSGSVIFTPWLNGERTPVDDHTLRGVVGQPVAVHDARRPGARGARRRRVQHEVAARRGREVRRPARSTRSGSSAAAPAPSCGARSTPTCSSATIELVDDPQAANVRGAGFLGLVGPRPGDVRRPRPRASRSARSPGPIPAATAIYRAARPGVPGLLPAHQVDPRPPQRLTDAAGRPRTSDADR